MFTVVGACTQCGAPIYTNTMWGGITPPPSMFSCYCSGAKASAAAPSAPPVKIQMHTSANPTTVVNPTIIEEHSTGTIIYG